MFRRIIISLLIAAGAVLGVTAITTPAASGASSASCPTGPVLNPYNIKYTNGVLAPYASMRNSNQFTPVISWQSGRRLYWTFVECTPQGWPSGYWENYKHQVLSANNACTTWELKNSRADNGTVTIDRIGVNKDGSHYALLGSRYCNPAWRTGAVNHIWASKDIAGKNLVMFNLNHPTSGLYLKVSFIGNAPRARR